MSYNCYKCNSAPVQEEFQRCASCQKEHEELCAKLDAQSRKKVERVREKEYPVKSIKMGREFTDWYTCADAKVLGIRIPECEK